MADTKKKAAPSVKPAALPMHPFEEMKHVKKEALVLGKKLRGMIIDYAPSSIKGPTLSHIAAEVERLTPIGLEAATEFRHAISPVEAIESGMAPGFQQAFNELLPRLSAYATPTEVPVLVLEETTVGLGLHNQKNVTHGHGHSTTAHARAATKALNPDAPLPLLVTRSVSSENGHIVDIAQNGMKVPGEDKAELLLKDRIYRHGKPKIISTSIGEQQPISDYSQLLKRHDVLNDRFGKDKLFFVASGNNGEDTDPAQSTAYMHNDVRHHEDSIIIGALYVKRYGKRDGGYFHAISATNYMTPSVDLTWASSPPNAFFLRVIAPAGQDVATAGVMMPLSQNGTSYSTPQSAGIAGEIARRVVASEENPDTIHTLLDVADALRITAQPVHVKQNIGLSIPFKPGDNKAVEVINPALQNAQLIIPHKVGNHYVSLDAGSGMISLDVLELLAKQQKAVMAGEAEIHPRKSLKFNAENTKATVDSSSVDALKPLLAGRSAQTLYRYTIDVPDDRVSSVVLMNGKSSQLAKKLFQSTSTKPALFLVSPDEQAVEMLPSAQKADNSFVMMRAHGMHHLPTEGKWTMYSSEPWEEVKLQLEHTMHPKHFAAAVVPSAAEHEEKLYRFADLASLPREEIDKLMLDENSNIYKNNRDLSKISLPMHYADITLAKAAKENPALAEKLLQCHYHDFADKEALAQAVASGKSEHVLNLLIPVEGRFEVFEKFAYYTGRSLNEIMMKEGVAPANKGKPSSFIAQSTKNKQKPFNDTLIFLAQNGFAALEKDVSSDTKPNRARTALMILGDYSNYEIDTKVVEAFIKNGTDLNKKDENGRTALHHICNFLSDILIMDVLKKENPEFDLSKIKDDNGRTPQYYWDLAFKQPPVMEVTPLNSPSIQSSLPIKNVSNAKTPAK